MRRRQSRVKQSSKRLRNSELRNSDHRLTTLHLSPQMLGASAVAAARVSHANRCTHVQTTPHRRTQVRRACGKQPPQALGLRGEKWADTDWQRRCRAACLSQALTCPATAAASPALRQTALTPARASLRHTIRIRPAPPYQSQQYLCQRLLPALMLRSWFGKPELLAGALHTMQLRCLAPSVVWVYNARV